MIGGEKMGLIGTWLTSLDYQYEILDECVRNKSSKATCKQCMEACAEDAITFPSKGKPSINSAMCTECGHCLSACPVQAVGGIFPNNSVVGNQLIVKNDYPLSVTELLVFYGKGITTIISKEGELDSAWDDNIQEADDILEKLGENPFVRTSELAPEEEQAFTRRQLFSFWGEESKSVAKSVTPAKWRFNHSSLELAKYYSEYQLFDIVIDSEKCTICKACEVLCSKKCFSFDENGFVVSNQACSNCQLCSDTCPEQAIMIQSHISKAVIKTYQTYQKTCIKCNDHFLTLRRQDDKCPKCVRSKVGYLSNHR